MVLYSFWGMWEVQSKKPYYILFPFIRHKSFWCVFKISKQWINFKPGGNVQSTLRLKIFCLNGTCFLALHGLFKVYMQHMYWHIYSTGIQSEFNSLKDQQHTDNIPWKREHSKDKVYSEQARSPLNDYLFFVLCCRETNVFLLTRAGLILQLRHARKITNSVQAHCCLNVQLQLM